MKGRKVEELVYEQMFPKPRPQDPHSFDALLQRHIILEVRQEVISFYGHLDTSEAKYPGLNYNNRTHRIRLSRWQWHRRLFRAFDALRLTPNEISAITHWEGTKWAKERYEREQNCVIRDTAMDGMPVWTGQESIAHRSPYLKPPVFQTAEGEDSPDTMRDEAAEEDSEDELESVGIALNQQLRERLAARNAGDSSLPLDEAWEQWFKNAVETGEISAVRERQRMMDNARAGNWGAIPGSLQNIIYNALAAEQRGTAATARRSRHGGAPSSVGGPLTSSQVGILSAPDLAAPTLPMPSQMSRTSWTGLRLPGAFTADGMRPGPSTNA